MRIQAKSASGADRDTLFAHLPSETFANAAGKLWHVDELLLRGQLGRLSSIFTLWATYCRFRSLGKALNPRNPRWSARLQIVPGGAIESPVIWRWRANFQRAVLLISTGVSSSSSMRGSIPSG